MTYTRTGTTHLLASRPGSHGEEAHGVGLAPKAGSCGEGECGRGAATPLFEFLDDLIAGATLVGVRWPYCLRAAAPEIGVTRPGESHAAFVTF